MQYPFKIGLGFTHLGFDTNWNGETRIKPQTLVLQQLTMVQTRSMSKADTETATDTKIVGRASKQTRKKATKNADFYLKRSTLDSKAKKTVSPTIDSEAMFIFMEDYMIRHPVQDFLQFDLIDSAGPVSYTHLTLPTIYSV